MENIVEPLYELNEVKFFFLFRYDAIQWSSRISWPSRSSPLQTFETDIYYVCRRSRRIFPPNRRLEQADGQFSESVARRSSLLQWFLFDLTLFSLPPQLHSDCSAYSIRCVTVLTDFECFSSHDSSINKKTSSAQPSTVSSLPEICLKKAVLFHGTGLPSHYYSQFRCRPLESAFPWIILTEVIIRDSVLHQMTQKPWYYFREKTLKELIYSLYGWSITRMSCKDE